MKSQESAQVKRSGFSDQLRTAIEEKISARLKGRMAEPDSEIIMIIRNRPAFR